MIKQEFLAMSLPYGLKCQYEGIITRELINIGDERFIHPTNCKYGSKIGLLKQVHVFKKYWIARCGIKHKGLKVFYNGIGLYPVLRPLSDLTKVIEHKGEKFVPIVELLKNSSFDTSKMSEEEIMSFVKVYSNTDLIALNDLPLYLQWHFDLFGGIESGEAINVNTLDINPYK